MESLITVSSRVGGSGLNVGGTNGGTGTDGDTGTAVEARGAGAECSAAVDARPRGQPHHDLQRRIRICCCVLARTGDRNIIPASSRLAGRHSGRLL